MSRTPHEPHLERPQGHEPGAMNRKPALSQVSGCQDGRPDLVGAPRAEAAPRFSLKAWRRVMPLALLLAAVALMPVLGWHRVLTLVNVVALRDRFHGMVAEHCGAAVAAYIAAYALLAALSMPGCPVVTAMGGLMFGSLVGGAAAVVGASLGATLLFLIARSAIGGVLRGRAAPWLVQMRQGVREGARDHSLFLRVRSGLSLLVCQHRAGGSGCSPQDLCDRDLFRHYAGHVRICIGRGRPRQRHYGSEGRIRALPGRRRCPSLPAQHPCELARHEAAGFG